jgi:hypothetical protein
LAARSYKYPKSRPVFVTERKARVQLIAADLDGRGRARLSHQQAAALLSGASGGATLDQLRHGLEGTAERSVATTGRGPDPDSPGMHKPSLSKSQLG